MTTPRTAATSTSSSSLAQPPDWKAYFGVVSYLEDILGRQVDLATIADVRKEIRPFVERDAVRV